MAYYSQPPPSPQHHYGYQSQSPRTQHYPSENDYPPPYLPYYPYPPDPHHSAHHSHYDAHRPRPSTRPSRPTRSGGYFQPTRQYAPGPSRPSAPQADYDSYRARMANQSDRFTQYMSANPFPRRGLKIRPPKWSEFEKGGDRPVRSPQKAGRRKPRVEIEVVMLNSDDEEEEYKDYNVGKKSSLPQTYAIEYSIPGQLTLTQAEFHDMLRNDAAAIIRVLPTPKTAPYCFSRTKTLLPASVTWSAIPWKDRADRSKLDVREHFFNSILSWSLWSSATASSASENGYEFNNGYDMRIVAPFEAVEYPCMLTALTDAGDQTGTLSGTTTIDYYLSQRYKSAVMSVRTPKNKRVPRIEAHKLIRYIHKAKEEILSNDPQELHDQISANIEGFLDHSDIDWDLPKFQIMTMAFDPDFREKDEAVLLEDKLILLDAIYYGTKILRRIEQLTILNTGENLGIFARLPTKVGCALAAASRWTRTIMYNPEYPKDLTISEVTMAFSNALLNTAKEALNWPYPTVGSIEERADANSYTRSWYGGLVLPGQIASWAFMISMLKSGSAESQEELSEIAYAMEGFNPYLGFILPNGSYWHSDSIVAKVLAIDVESSEFVFNWLHTPLNFFRYVTVKNEEERVQVRGPRYVAIAQYLSKYNRPAKNPDEPDSSSSYMGASDFRFLPARSNPLGLGVSPLELKKLPDPPTYIQEVTLGAFEKNGQYCKAFGLAEPSSYAEYYRIIPQVTQTTHQIVLKSAELKPAHRGYTDVQLDFDIEGSLYPTTDRDGPDRERKGKDLKNSTRTRKVPSMGVVLQHTVDFVAAPECFPDDETRSLVNAFTSEASHHLLHRSFKFTVISAHRELVDDEDGRFYDWVPGKTDEGMLVILASESIDSQILARAWCSNRGLSAMVTTRRGCIACAIRTAAGCKIRVVIVAESSFVVEDGGEMAIVTPEPDRYQRCATKEVPGSKTNAAGDPETRRGSVASLYETVDARRRHDSWQKYKSHSHGY